MALFLGSLAVSCGEDSPKIQGEPESSIVSFLISNETTASRDGSSALESQPLNIGKLVCAVYDSRGNLLPELGDGPDGLIVINPESFPTSLELTLVKDQTYRIVLWAQSDLCDSFIHQNLADISADYSKIATIDPHAEVFSKSEIFTVVGNETRTITLRRNVANLNIRMTKDDFSRIAEEFGMNLVESRISIPYLRCHFDAVADNAFYSDEEDPSEINTLLASSILEEEDHMVLASTFVFASFETEMIDGVNLELFGNDGRNLKIPLEKMPLQRNWATNITLTAETVINTINQE